MLEAIDTGIMEETDVERLNRYHAEVYRKISPYVTEDERAWLKDVTRQVNKK